MIYELKNYRRLSESVPAGCRAAGPDRRADSIDAYASAFSI